MRLRSPRKPTCCAGGSRLKEYSPSFHTSIMSATIGGGRLLCVARRSRCEQPILSRQKPSRGHAVKATISAISQQFWAILMILYVPIADQAICGSDDLSSRLRSPGFFTYPAGAGYIIATFAE